jgi:hypothetical protein
MSGTAYACIAIVALVVGLVAPAAANTATAEEKPRAAGRADVPLNLPPGSASNERR